MALPLRSSLIAKIKWAAIHGRTFHGACFPFRAFQKAYFTPRFTLLYFWLLSLKRPL